MQDVCSIELIAQKKRIDNGIQEGRKWTLGNTKASKDMSETNSDEAIHMEFYTERERRTPWVQYDPYRDFLWYGISQIVQERQKVQQEEELGHYVMFYIL